MRIYNGTGLQYEYSPLTVSTVYSFTVIAVNDYGSSSPSSASVLSTAPPAAITSAPTAQSITNTDVTIAWGRSADDTGENGIEVSYIVGVSKTGSGPFTEFSSDVSFFVDFGQFRLIIFQFSSFFVTRNV